MQINRHVDLCLNSANRGRGILPPVSPLSPHERTHFLAAGTAQGSTKKKRNKTQTRFELISIWIASIDVFKNIAVQIFSFFLPPS